MSSSSLSELTERQAEIVREWHDIIEDSYNSGRRPVLFSPNYVLKFNFSYNIIHGDIIAQSDTQAFVYAASENSPGAPRVPEVYECFRWDGVEYLVMERINHPTVGSWIGDASISKTEAESRSEIAYQAVADALRWLFSLTPPAGAEIGLIKGSYSQTFPINGGKSQNAFFGYSGASFRFPDGAALQRHVVKALSNRPRGAPPCEVTIAEEPLTMVQCDIEPENFLIDPQTHQVTLIDFSCVCVLPSSFVGFAVCDGINFIKGINKYLNWKWSDNILALREATYIYCLGGHTFGLDENGFPAPRKRKNRYPPLPKSSTAN